MNYFESEYYKITVTKNPYNDKFILSLNNNKDHIIIKRNIETLGWGQDLKLIFRNKILQKEEVLIIGNSTDNSKTHKIPEYLLVSQDHPKIHYEDDIIIMFHFSEIYNDTFKIDYDSKESLLEITRIDSNTGWGQDLKLMCLYKETNESKIINIGTSKTNKHSKIITFKDSPILKTLNSQNNLMDSENYQIYLFDNNENDAFHIFFYEETSLIYIKRLDKNEGWGQKLKIKISHKKANKSNIIYIGNSKTNEFYKKIDLSNKKCYVSLTTIPSRAKLPIFYDNIVHFLTNQTHDIENFFITIAKKYKRFEETIDLLIIEKLRKIPKVIIIEIENDYGPSSKYMGPLLNYFEILENNLLIVIDDDRKYNKNLVRNFHIGFSSFPNIQFSSGLFQLYFKPDYANTSDNLLEYIILKEHRDHKLVEGQGLGGFYGFGLKINSSFEKFINYNLTILEKIPKSFLHDEGIILGYLKANEENILYIKHRGCNLIENEMVDALCKSNLCNRSEVEKDILNVTYLENLL